MWWRPGREQPPGIVNLHKKIPAQKCDFQICAKRFPKCCVIWWVGGIATCCDHSKFPLWPNWIGSQSPHLSFAESKHQWCWCQWYLCMTSSQTCDMQYRNCDHELWPWNEHDDGGYDDNQQINKYRDDDDAGGDPIEFVYPLWVVGESIFHCQSTFTT